MTAASPTGANAGTRVAPLPADQRSLYRDRGVGAHHHGHAGAGPGAGPRTPGRPWCPKGIVRAGPAGALRARVADAVQRPGRVGSTFLLSGLLRCGSVWERLTSVRGPRAAGSPTTSVVRCSGKGAGTCTVPLPECAPKVEAVRRRDTIKARILNDATITELVTLVAEEIDAVAGEVAGRLQSGRSESWPT